jgi:transcriptional regulator with XRE-family HTH domain
MFNKKSVYDEVIIVQTAQRGEIGKRVFDVLERQRLSQAELSKGTGIPIGTISDWSRKGTNPSSDKIACISEFLKVSTEWLLTGEERAAQNTIGNVTNSAFVVGENKGSVVVRNGSERVLSTEAAELLHIYEELDFRGRLELLNKALALKDGVPNKIGEN